MGTVVESKVVAGSFAGVVTGLLTWALVTYIPAFRNGIPDQLAPFIPVIAAWLCSTAAAYLAPHTHRPDLPAPVLKPAQDVTVTPPPPARLGP